jgi:hypothetical protein
MDQSSFDILRGNLLALLVNLFAAIQSFVNKDTKSIFNSFFVVEFSFRAVGVDVDAFSMINALTPVSKSELILGDQNSLAIHLVV